MMIWSWTMLPALPSMRVRKDGFVFIGFPSEPFNRYMKCFRKTFQHHLFGIVNMNNETYDQIAIDNETVGDSLKFVKENEVVKVCSYNGSVFAIEAPLFVELEITETEPGFKGDTAQGATKPAIVETGATVYVPLFVDQGDRIKIDTRTGEYLSRV